MIWAIFLKENRREKEEENGGTVKCIGGDNGPHFLFVLPSSNTRGRGGTWEKQKHEETHMHHKENKRQYTQRTTHTDIKQLYRYIQWVV